MFNVDSLFVIGKDHHICQDFATHSNEVYVDVQYPIVIICDGCSKGGEDNNGLDVDIGARILAKMAAIAFYPYEMDTRFNPMEVAQKAVKDSLDITSKLWVHENSLFSTLLVAHVHHNMASIMMFGDGVCYFRDKTGNIEYNVISFTGNAPFYLFYHVKEEFLARYLASKTREGEDFGTATVETFKDGKLNKSVVDKTQSSCFIFERPIDEISSFGIMSDGILSGLYSPRSIKHDIPADRHEMITKATNIPNFSGPFARRRLNKFVKDCRDAPNGFKNEIEFGDDLSLAVIANLGG